MTEDSRQNHEPPLNLSTSFSASTMSTSKIQSIFQHCVDLSTDKKIDQKNAFDLKLIDCMNKITEISEENDLQMASSALDASTTIYSKRIDILHEQTNSLLSRIAMGDLDRIAEPDKTDDNENSDITEKAPNRKQVTKPKIIDENLINLRSKNLKQILSKPFTKGCNINMKEAASSLTSVLRLDKRMQWTAPAFQTSDVNFRSLSQSEAHEILQPKAEYLQPLYDIVENDLNICKVIKDYSYNSNFTIDDKYMETSFSQKSFNVADAGDPNESFSHAPDFDPVELIQETVNPQNMLDAKTIVENKLSKIVAHLDMHNMSINDVMKFIDKRPRSPQLTTEINPDCLSQTTIPLPNSKKSSVPKPKRPVADFEQQTETTGEVRKQKPSKNRINLIMRQENPGFSLSTKIFAVNDKFLKFENADMNVAFVEDGEEHNQAAIPFEIGKEVAIDDIEYDYNNENDMTFCPEPLPDNNSIDDNDQIIDGNDLAENAAPFNFEALQDNPLSQFTQNANNDDAFAEIYKFENLNIPKLNVNMRTLKSTMWINIKENIGLEQTIMVSSKKQKKSAPNEESVLDDHQFISFDKIVSETTSRLPDKDQKNICFGTQLMSLLHLASEKGLDLKKSGEEILVRKC